MGSVNQTRPHCVNQMGKTQSKPFSGTARQGNGMGAACYVLIGLYPVTCVIIYTIPDTKRRHIRSQAVRPAGVVTPQSTHRELTVLQLDCPIR